MRRVDTVYRLQIQSLSLGSQPEYQTVSVTLRDQHGNIREYRAAELKTLLANRERKPVTPQIVPAGKKPEPETKPSTDTGGAGPPPPAQRGKGVPPQESDEDRVRRVTWEKLQANPESYLAEYTKRFGNVLNADDAATLFDE